MKGKILLLTGLAVGYVFGSRAGKERYEEIKTAANKLWADPRVQKPVRQAEEFVKDKGPEVADFVSDGVKNVVNKVQGKPATAAKKPAATKPATSSTPSSTPSTPTSTN